MSPLEQLQARREAILAELALLSPVSPGGKPSYQIDGQQVDHTGYRLSLYRELELIDRLIVREQSPHERRSRGVT